MGPRRSALCLSLALACAIGALGAGGCGGDDDESEGSRVIVSIGDSVASGEGNPTSRELGRLWLTPQKCHRSPLSGHQLAAAEIRRREPEIGFVSYACTGATIAHGLVGSFRPKRFSPAEPPQLERLRTRAESSTVEAVLVSVGANDVGFSDIVQFCATEPACYDSTKFAPARKWAAEQQVEIPTLREFTAQRIRDLGELYAEVNEGIPSGIPRERVLIVEYFDPTRHPGQTQCAIFRKQVVPLFEDDLVTVDESRWAHDEVLIPLNAAIDDAADAHGWTLVDEVDEGFAGHGICAEKPDRWIRTLSESLAQQRDQLGTLHPNEAGQAAIADRIAPVLAEQLGVSDSG